MVDEPFIVARNKAGEVRAMSAVCQHRAMQVCEGEGNSTTFKCPYHHWIYGLDGRLLGAPAMERTEAFNKADFGLPQLRVEEWLGFVFVNFDPDASSRWLPRSSATRRLLKNYDLANAVCPGTFTLEGHAVELEGDVRELQRRVSRQPTASSSCRTSVRRTCRAFPVPWDDDSNVVFRTGWLHPHRRWLQPHPPRHHGGLPRPDRGRTDPFDVRPHAAHAVLSGLLLISASSFLIRPTGPETIDVEIGYIFHPSALDDPLFEQKVALVGCRRAGLSSTRTKTRPPRCSRGLRSRFAPRGRYSWQEESHIQFNRWLVQRYQRQVRWLRRRRGEAPLRPRSHTARPQSSTWSSDHTGGTP